MSDESAKCVPDVCSFKDLGASYATLKLTDITEAEGRPALARSDLPVRRGDKLDT